MTQINNALAMIKSEKAQKQIERVLAAKLPPEEFFLAAEAAVRANPKLNQCTRESLWDSYVACAEYALLPNTHHGHCFLIPRWNGREKVMKCEFQMGYKGYIELIHRSGKVKSVAADVVYSNDVFEMVKGTDKPILRHEIERGPRGDMQGAWALVDLTNDGKIVKYLDKQEIEEARPEKWEKLFNTWASKKRAVIAEMWIKTVLIRVMKLAPLTDDGARLVGVEQRMNEMGLLPEPGAATRRLRIANSSPLPPDAEDFPFDRTDPIPDIPPQLPSSEPPQAPLTLTPEPQEAETAPPEGDSGPKPDERLLEAQKAGFWKAAQEDGWTRVQFEAAFQPDKREAIGLALNLPPEEVAAIMEGE